MRILIVDDDPIALTLMHRILSGRGHGVIEASSAQSALEVLGSAAPVGLVVTDLAMPDMDGIQFLSRLRETPGLNELPVMVCSAKRERSVVLQALELGITDYVLKPVDATVLLHKVGVALADQPSPFENEYTVRTRLGLDPFSLLKMIRGLVRSLPAEIDDMERLLGQADFGGVAELAGRLGRGAVNIGANRLGTALEKLEGAARSQDPSAAGGAIVELRREANILKDHTVRSLRQSGDRDEWTVPSDLRGAVEAAEGEASESAAQPTPPVPVAVAVGALQPAAA